MLHALSIEGSEFFKLFIVKRKCTLSVTEIYTIYICPAYGDRCNLNILIIHCVNSLYYCVVPLYNYWSSTMMIMSNTLQAEEISFYHIFGIFATIKPRLHSGN